MTTNNHSEERREMVRQFYESGMTQKDFALVYGVTRSTLGYWVRRLRAKESSTETASMVPVGSVMSPTRSAALRVITRSGVTVEMDLPASEETIQTVLKAVQSI